MAMSMSTMSGGRQERFLTKRQAAAAQQVLDRQVAPDTGSCPGEEWRTGSVREVTQARDSGGSRRTL